MRLRIQVSVEILLSIGTAASLYPGLGGRDDIRRIPIARFRDVYGRRRLTTERDLGGAFEIARRRSNRDPRARRVGLNIDDLRLAANHPHAANGNQCEQE